MGNVSLTLIHNRQKRGTSQKAVSVELKFSCGGQRKYISTGVKVTPNQWSGQKVIRCKDADALNKQLDAFTERANEVVAKANRAGVTDIKEVAALWNNNEGKRIDFPSYCEKRASERNVSANTKVRYMVFVRFLKKWGKIRTFEDCNAKNIRSMDEYLHKQGKKQSTIYDYHKFLKLFIHDACIDEYLNANPYTNLSFSIGRGEKQYVDCINETQFNALKKLDFTTPHLEKARDLFLFQCYTGMAYSDLMAFDYSNCVEEDGKLFYHAKRTKTDTDFVFLLLAPAVKLLAKYSNVLPKMSNQKYNDYLKAIGTMIGVENMHTHMGRATAATLFLSKGMPINVVAKVLGHTTLRQTTRYARTLNKDVIGAFDKLNGKL